MLEQAKKECFTRLNEIYGDLLDERIINRLEKELEAFNEINQIENLFIVKEIVANRLNKGELILPRLSLGNSLVMYLLGLSNVNPLPRHTYCPKCHHFHWGNKLEETCPICDEPLIEDGYDLDYRLYIDDIKRVKHPFSFSTSSKKKIGDYYSFYPSEGLKLAKLLGFKQSDLMYPPSDLEEVIKCFDSSYYDSHYRKRKIVDHQAFISIEELGNKRIQAQIVDDDSHTFDELVKSVLVMHGTGVRLANKRYGTDIYSRDDLFKFLKDNQLSDSDALLICKETRLSGQGHLSSLSESKLLEAKVEPNYIEFMKSISYIFLKAHEVAHLKMLLKLAKINLEDPHRFYKAYFTLHKKEPLDLKEISESRLTNNEQIYLSLVDYDERK